MTYNLKKLADNLYFEVKSYWAFIKSIVVSYITNFKINIIVHYMDARSNLRRKVTLLCPILSTIIQFDFKFSGVGL